MVLLVSFLMKCPPFPLGMFGGGGGVFGSGVKVIVQIRVFFQSFRFLVFLV